MGLGGAPAGQEVRGRLLFGGGLVGGGLVSGGFWAVQAEWASEHVFVVPTFGAAVGVFWRSRSRVMCSRRDRAL